MTNKSLGEFYGKFKKFHQIYAPYRTFVETCAFLDGFEYDSEVRVLRQFHGWILTQYGGRPELYWSPLVLCKVFDMDPPPDPRVFTRDQNEQAVAGLFELLDKFFSVEKLLSENSR